MAAQHEYFAEGIGYERFMGRWSRRLAPVFLEFAGVTNGERVLDVGSGTGSLSLAIAEASPASQITGIDPSGEYVRYAQSQARGKNLRFAVGDAQRLQFPDASFDRTVSLLVINFIPDPGKALREMKRVTRPGGIVAAAVWDYDDGMKMLRLFWDEAVALDAAVEPRDERHMPLCRKGQLAALWQEQGLVEMEERPISVDLVFSTFDDYWAPFLAGQGPAGAYVKQLSEPARSALAARLRQRLLGGRADGPITLPARAWAVRGRVPAR